MLSHIYLWEEKVTLPFMPVMSGSVSSLSCSLTAITAAETGKEVEDRQVNRDKQISYTLLVI